VGLEGARRFIDSVGAALRIAAVNLEFADAPSTSAQITIAMGPLAKPHHVCHARREARNLRVSNDRVSSAAVMDFSHRGAKTGETITQLSPKSGANVRFPRAP
jgi:hypothetical protein